MPVPRVVLNVGAAAFLLAMAGYSAASIYYNPRRFPPATLGATGEYVAADGALRIDHVEQEGPGARAGLHPGDRIEAVNGRPLATPVPFWDAIDRGQPGATVRLSIHRPQDQAIREVAVQLDPFRLPAAIGQMPMTTTRQLALVLLAFYPLPFFIVAAVVLVQRVHDRHAWLLGLMFGGFIVSGLSVPELLPVIQPALRRRLLAMWALFGLAVPGALYCFFAGFPEPTWLDRRLPWLKRPPAWISPRFGCSPVRHGAREPGPAGSLASRPLTRRAGGGRRRVRGLQPLRVRPRPGVARPELVRRAAGDQAAHPSDARGYGGWGVVGGRLGVLHRASRPARHPDPEPSVLGMGWSDPRALPPAIVLCVCDRSIPGDGAPGAPPAKRPVRGRPPRHRRCRQRHRGGADVRLCLGVHPRPPGRHRGDDLGRSAERSRHSHPPSSSCRTVPRRSSGRMRIRSAQACDSSFWGSATRPAWSGWSAT